MWYLNTERSLKEVAKTFRTKKKYYLVMSRNLSNFIHCLEKIALSDSLPFWPILLRKTSYGPYFCIA